MGLFTTDTLQPPIADSVSALTGITQTYSLLHFICQDKNRTIISLIHMTYPHVLPKGIKNLILIYCSCPAYHLTTAVLNNELDI